jgi:hypothetical protein
VNTEYTRLSRKIEQNDGHLRVEPLCRPYAVGPPKWRIGYYTGIYRRVLSVWLRHPTISRRRRLRVTCFDFVSTEGE